jgi:hypothetical protein
MKPAEAGSIKDTKRHIHFRFERHSPVKLMLGPRLVPFQNDSTFYLFFLNFFHSRSKLIKKNDEDRFSMEEISSNWVPITHDHTFVLGLIWHVNFIGSKNERIQHES